MEIKLGLCKGISTKDKGNGIVETYVLVVSEGRDEYGQVVDVTTGIRIGKSHLEAGVDRIYQNYAGKQVAVPFFPKPWKSKAGNVGLERWLAGDGKPVNIQVPTPVRAAS